MGIAVVGCALRQPQCGIVVPLNALAKNVGAGKRGLRLGVALVRGLAPEARGLSKVLRYAATVAIAVAKVEERAGVAGGSGEAHKVEVLLGRRVGRNEARRKQRLAP